MIKRKEFQAKLIIVYNDNSDDHMPDDESESLVVLSVEQAINSMGSVKVDDVGDAHIRLHMEV